MNSKTSLVGGVRTAVGVLTAMGCSMVSLTQSTNAAESKAASETVSLEEVVVTALKRNTTIQQVPTTVLVSTGADLRAAGIASIDQITQVVPGIRIQTAPAGLVNPTMRGLGSSPSNNSFEQTVGLFADGIYLGHPRDYTLALFDVERVELLKGTQSAVLGKNTSVGAISMVTKKPTREMGFEGSYLHEFVLGGDLVDAAINIPTGETLAVRVAGQINRQDGHLENDINGRDEPNIKSSGVRATVGWTPTEDLTWTASVQHAEYRLIGYPFYAASDPSGQQGATAVLYGDPNFTAAPNDRTRLTGRPGMRDLGVDTSGERYTSNVELLLGGYTLTSVSGYSTYTDHQMVGVNGVITNPAVRAGDEINNSFSQELRIVSPDSGPFNWLGGVYYYNDIWKFADLFDILPMAQTPISGANLTHYKQKTESLSGFAQGTYAFTGAFKATIGVRYDNARKQGSYVRDILRPGLFSALIYQPFAPTTLNRRDKFFDYSSSIQYEFLPDMMAYASYATGSKGGGFQVDPTNIAVAEFPDETAETAELGVKLGIARGSHINLAYFDTRVHDYQIALFQGLSFNVRADQIHSRGGELEVLWRMLDALTFTANVTYTDVAKVVVPANSIATLPFAPEWSGVGKLAYQSPEFGQLQFAADAIVEFRSRQFLSDALSNYNSNPALYSDGSYTKFNLRLAMRHEKSGIEVAVVGKNLFDTHVINYAFPAFQAGGGVMISTDSPRTIGLQLSVKR